MKKTVLAIAFFNLLAANAQEPPRLIVRGDDMGYSHSGNLALIKSYTDGIETSIEVIVPSPWFPEAVKLLKQNPGVDVGIHLALTSEWENIKWRPLSDCKSLKDATGYFYPMIAANPNYPGQSILENKWTIADVEKEFRAQIETALRLIPNISHVSSHMGCTTMTEEVRQLTNRLASEYKIPIAHEPKGLEWATYDGPSKTPEEKVKSFVSMLQKLEAGKTYLFLDHPGFDDAELRAIYHIGYEEVAMDRQGVTDLFTNEVVKKVIRDKSIKLIGYKDLSRK